MAAAEQSPDDGAGSAPAPSLRLARVLGAGPFREIGSPLAVATSPDGSLIAVGGRNAFPQWHARDVKGRSRPHAGWYPTGVYSARDLACLHLLTTFWPVNAVAFHPTMPLLAIGTGSYDGGYQYEGELLLLHLDTGRVVSLLAQPREVRRISWLDAETLDLVLAVPCDDDEEQLGTTSLACSLHHEDWRTAPTGLLRMPLPESPVALDAPDPAQAQGMLESLCRERGLALSPRGGVWAIEPMRDGSVVAALEDTGAECWPAQGSQPRWQATSIGSGYQVRALPGADRALVLTQGSNSFEGGRWRRPPSVLVELDVADGIVHETHEPGFSAVVVSRADGAWALRDADFERRHAAGVARLPGAVTADLGRYDLINHFFDIRYAPELLFLRGSEREPWRDKWLVAVDLPDGRVRPLYPLEWDMHRNGHLFGGCGAYLDGSLVHTGAVHDGGGLLHGNAFVVSRDHRSGKPRWIFNADNTATALDTDGDAIYVAFNNGELVVLGAQDGAVLLREMLRVEGHPVVPLSLAMLGRKRLMVGTSDGRLLEWTAN